MTGYKGYRYRIYPNTEQKEQFAKTFGCCRFVYNRLLALQQERYAKGEKHLSKIDANNYCVRVLKNEFPWLREVDKFALTKGAEHPEAVVVGRFSKPQRSCHPPQVDIFYAHSIALLGYRSALLVAEILPLVGYFLMKYGYFPSGSLAVL